MKLLPQTDIGAYKETYTFDLLCKLLAGVTVVPGEIEITYRAARSIADGSEAVLTYKNEQYVIRVTTTTRHI